MGVQLENIQPKNTLQISDASTSIWKKEITFGRSNIGNKGKENFFIELSILLSSGIRLKESLSLIGDSQKKEKEHSFYHQMAKSILDGKDFSQVLEENKGFGSYDVQSIKIGERTGTLNNVSLALGNYYKEKNQLRRSITGALTYPTIVLSTALLAVIFMLRFVVPMFQDVFRQNNIDLPAITQAVISTSNWLGKYGVFIIGILILLIAASKIYGENHIFKSSKDALLLKIPFLGNFIRLVHMTRFTQAVSLLVSARISIPESINLSKDMMSFTPLVKALNQVKLDILKGDMLSESLKRHTIFDAKMTALVRVAEETNQTAKIFVRLNEQYAREVTAKSKHLSTLLEPIIILAVGLIVGFILIAMYLPMFELGNVLN